MIGTNDQDFVAWLKLINPVFGWYLDIRCNDMILVAVRLVWDRNKFDLC